jgi:hypothetical protein
MKELIERLERLEDGVSEEEPDPNYAKNAGYMKGYENGLMDIRS